MLTQFMILYFLSAPDVSRSLPEWSAAAFGILVSMATETQQPGGKKHEIFWPIIPPPSAGLWERRPEHHTGSKYGN